MLTVERDGGIAVLTLARPEKRNALSIELRLELADVFGRLGHDEGVGCIVLTGAGAAFCAGMDTSQFGGDRANRERIVESSVACFEALIRSPRAVLAAVNGPALAGGFALSLFCDVRLASTQATFGFPEATRGIPPGYAAARAALSPAVARDLCLSGRIVDAEEALRLGVVSEVCQPAGLLPRARERAAAIAALPPNAVEETRSRILRDGERSWRPLLEEEMRQLRERVMGEGPDEAA